MAERASDVVTLPEASSLVSRARARLAAQLEGLPPWGSPLLAARLRVTTRPQPVSLGVLAYFLRVAVQQHNAPAARDLFTTLVARIEGMNVRWAARTVARTPTVLGADRDVGREDLLQELALSLWRQFGRGDGEAFELFFFRALAYTQQHVATAYMVQRGYWSASGGRPSERALTLLLSQLAPRDDAGEARAYVIMPDARDAFTASDLADLRDLVLTLPARERMTVVMRFWQQAPEAEIAESLGVSTRTIRNYLRQAYGRLRVAYAGAGGGV